MRHFPNLDKSVKFIVSLASISLLFSIPVNSDENVEKFEKKAKEFGLSKLNQTVDQLEDNIVSDTNVTHIEISVGEDLFELGNSSDDTKTKTEALLVYRLYEDDGLFVFNQSSVVNFAGRQTINLGLGARSINSENTIILGANGFYDHELQSDHKRVGFGVEALTSNVEFRANSYHAVSNAITYKGINEEALDGYDYRVAYNLPFFYSSSIFATEGRWDDGKDYNVETSEWGLKAELLPNLHISMASQAQDNDKDATVASLAYQIPLGSSKQVSQRGDNLFNHELTPIREKLYKPVQRENRIMKKSIALGVTVSGY